MRNLIMLFCLAVPAVSQAATFFESNWEQGSVEAEGWGWNVAKCGWSPGTSPCPYLDISSDVSHSGTHSLKGTFNAAWSDPNPQINTQGIFHMFGGNYTNVYNRYWVYTIGFTYSTPGTKNIYWKGDTGSNGLPNGYSIHHYGGRIPGFVWQTPVGTTNYFPNMNTGTVIPDNQWTCLEEHVDIVAGTIEIWVNGTQVLGVYGANLRQGTSQTFSNHEIYKQNGDGLRYIDQFASGDTRIGCNVDNSPPTAPTGLSVR